LVIGRCWVCQPDGAESVAFATRDVTSSSILGIGRDVECDE
jgi:hypothetical protein